MSIPAGSSNSEKEKRVTEELANRLTEPAKPFQSIENYRKASPCSSTWKNEEGKERVRFCEKCQCQVYDFTGMEMSEAEELIFKCYPADQNTLRNPIYSSPPAQPAGPLASPATPAEQLIPSAPVPAAGGTAGSSQAPAYSAAPTTTIAVPPQQEPPAASPAPQGPSLVPPAQQSSQPKSNLQQDNPYVQNYR